MSDQRFVEVNSERMEAFLQSKGFERTTFGDEVVYFRKHDKYPKLQVKVYTSIRIGSSAARGCGADAIRVVAIFDDGKKSFGVGKFPRVYRTGTEEGVFERTLLRMKEAYQRCNDWLKIQRRKQAQVQSNVSMGS
jgi:hypothetical protein